MRVSEKFSGHGIVGNNAWARPGGSEQKNRPTLSAQNTPQNFPDFIYTEKRRATGLAFMVNTFFMEAT